MAVFILSMLIEPIKTILQVEPPRRGPLSRFIRYMGCVMIACGEGCYSDEAITWALEYEGNKVIKSCNQLLQEEFGCDLSTKGATYCGSSIKYTFNEDTPYVGNYYLEKHNPSTYGTCTMFSKEGWNTDASCIGDWEDNILDCGCLSCRGITCCYSVRPEGMLFKKTGGCGLNSAYADYSGVIWIPESMIAATPTPGKCIEDTERGGLYLARCDFEEGQEIQIWADEINPSRRNCFNAWIFGKCWGTSLEGIPFHNCYQVAICEP